MGRLLAKLGMADMFKGVEEVDGKDYDVSADPNCVKLSRKPFKCILDIGFTRSTVGNRVFGVLKGACDGGLHIPHSVKKFPGYSYDEDSKKGEYTAEAHQDRIYGCHIGKYDACLKKAGQESVEDLFIHLHKSIRADPVHKKKKVDKRKPQYTDAAKTLVKHSKGSYLRCRKLTRQQKQANLQMKIKIAREAAA